ncbi:Lysophospholipase L1 [Agreia bicolorata]|uniref:Lysophospholipase L1 n=1 Tax=Agreia bicolorata TaxID=110935 RepID=A0A1T4WS52_9MICO|nr:GDSL-type esterase/lipase family protein [Agreia bicolorata]KJC64232.1 hypothetical protein TZ00_07030 [Agreia bicolorata]SKA80190.1 Lysophospholipase L1 [Agreia bicolorata]
MTKLDAETWIAGWTQAVTDIGQAPEVSDVTMRIQVRLTLAGSAIRFVLSNRLGTAPILIGEAAAVFADRSAPVSFDGRPWGEIPPGGELTSDALATDENDGRDVVIDVYLPEATTLSTGNIAGAAWSPSDAGNHVGDPVDAPVVTPSVTAPDGTSFTRPTPLLRAVEILSHDVTAVVACLGDSITAAGWPERASALLTHKKVVLLNRGISGNRLRRDGAGPAGSFFGRSGLERFTSDVLGTSGVTHAVLALGTNDLGHPGTPAAPTETVPSAEDLINALDVLVNRCVAADVVPILATITPFLPADGYDADRERTRHEVNGWIRAVSPPARFLDFDLALRSSSDPSRLADEFDSGDHLHPNGAGQSRLAEACVALFA